MEPRHVAPLRLLHCASSTVPPPLRLLQCIPSTYPLHPLPLLHSSPSTLLLLYSGLPLPASLPVTLPASLHTTLTCDSGTPHPSSYHTQFWKWPLTHSWLPLPHYITLTCDNGLPVPFPLRLDTYKLLPEVVRHIWVTIYKQPYWVEQTQSG